MLWGYEFGSVQCDCFPGVLEGAVDRLFARTLIAQHKIAVIAQRDTGKRPAIVRIKLERSPEHLARADVAFPGIRVELCGAALNEMPGIEILRLLCRQPANFRAFHLRRDDCGYLSRQFILQIEQVRELAVECFGPDMVTRLRIDKLSRDPNPARALADATFEDVAGGECLADLLNIDGLVLEHEGRVSRNDGERTPERQRCDDVLREAVGKKPLFGIIAQIGKRKHRDRGLVGQRKRRRGPRARFVRRLNR